LGTTRVVAFADGGEGLVEAGTSAVGASEAVVQVDAFLRDAELAEPVALGG
jgi:glycerate kinase